MNWGLRSRMAAIVVATVVLTWCSLFIAYDYRSPVNQLLHGMGTVPLQGWGAHELEDACIRLEAPLQVPTYAADKAVVLAGRVYPAAYVRELVLASFTDTCSGAAPRLAWVVSVAWPVSTDLSDQAVYAAAPRAVAIVDALSGALIAVHAEGRP